MKKAILILCSGGEIVTEYYNDIQSAYQAMKKRFDEIVIAFDGDSECDGYISDNEAYFKYCADSGDSLDDKEYVWKIQAIPKALHEISCDICDTYNEKTPTNKLSLDIGSDNLNLTVEKADKHSPFQELHIYFEDKETGLVHQDIALVRQAIKEDSLEKIPNKVDCLIWADSENEDYTHKFVINHWNEEEDDDDEDEEGEEVG